MEINWNLEEGGGAEPTAQLRLLKNDGGMKIEYTLWAFCCSWIRLLKENKLGGGQEHKQPCPGLGFLGQKRWEVTPSPPNDHCPSCSGVMKLSGTLFNSAHEQYTLPINGNPKTTLEIG